MPWKILDNTNTDPTQGPVVFIFEKKKWEEVSEYEKLVFDPFALRPGFYFFEKKDAKESKTSVPLVTKAEQKEEVHRYLKAPINRLRKRLRQSDNPEDILAEVFHKEESLKEAQQLLQPCVEKLTTLADFFDRLIEQKQEAKAFQFANELKDQNPKFSRFDPLVTLGNCFAKVGKDNEALKAYQAVLENEKYYAVNITNALMGINAILLKNKQFEQLFELTKAKIDKLKDTKVWEKTPFSEILKIWQNLADAFVRGTDETSIRLRIRALEQSLKEAQESNDKAENITKYQLDCNHELANCYLDVAGKKKDIAENKAQGSLDEAEGASVQEQSEFADLEKALECALRAGPEKGLHVANLAYSRLAGRPQEEGQQQMEQQQHPERQQQQEHLISQVFATRAKEKEPSFYMLSGYQLVYAQHKIDLDFERAIHKVIAAANKERNDRLVAELAEVRAQLKHSQNEAASLKQENAQLKAQLKPDTQRLVR